MASTYTNYTARVLDGLQRILAGEFGRKPPIVWGDQSERPGVEYLQLDVLATRPTDVQGSRRGRIYVVAIDYVYRFGQLPDYRRAKDVGEIVERTEQVLDDNAALFTVGGVYYWHRITLGDTEYAEATTEADEADGYTRVRLQIEVHVDKLNP